MSGYSGDIGDSLLSHDGVMFNTYDKDQDLSHGNCAIAHKGAWWYTHCGRSSLNAAYRDPYYTGRCGVRWNS